MSTISDNYNTLKENIAKCSSYAMYIDFVVGDLEFCTDSKNDYMMSLEHKKNGTGKANSFTLQVCHCPKPNGSESLLDNNYIDFSIDVSTQECEFEYGYVFTNGERLISPKYSGRVIDYTIEIRDSKVYYTFTGYSSIASLKDIMINMTAKQLKETANGTYNPLELAKGLMEKSIKEYRGSATGDKYKVEIDVGTYAPEMNKELFSSGAYDRRLFEYIRDILNVARTKNQAKLLDGDGGWELDGSTLVKTNTFGNVEETQSLVVYDFVIDDIDKDGYKTIRIVAIDASKEATNSNETIEMVFEWMSGRLDDVVLNFTPNFSGAVAISNANGVMKEIYGDYTEGVASDLSQRTHAIDSNGKVVETLNKRFKTDYAPTNGTVVDNDMLGAVGLIAFYNSLVYTGTLNTLGMPDDIPILTHIKIVPLIYGNEHHSAGEYYILSQTNSIGLSGFTTVFEVCRVSGSADFNKALREKYNVQLKYQASKDRQEARETAKFENAFNPFKAPDVNNSPYAKEQEAENGTTEMTPDEKDAVRRKIIQGIPLT